MKILGLRIERDKTVRKVTLGDIQRARVQMVEDTGWAIPGYGNYYAQSVPAFRAIKLRADAVAGAPLRVMRQLRNGEQEPVGPEHPAQQLLDRVNDWWTHADLLRATETNLCLWGSAYWFLEKRGNVPVGIWPLRPDRIRVVPEKRNMPGSYIAGFLYTGPMGQRLPLTRDELVWFRYYNPLDEYAGLSPLGVARLSLDMGRNALRFNSSFFENGAVPGDVIYPVQGPITDEEIEDFYRRLEVRHKGVGRAHRPMVVDLSMTGKPERLGLSQRDMEFLASLNFTVEEAARVWGVPPPKMYSQAQSTYNNVKQADVEFYTDTVSNEWRFLETEITEMLLPIMGESGLLVAFDTGNVLPLQEALAELHGRQREDVKVGLLTINEVRASRHLEPVSWGDNFWGPLTLISLGQEGEAEEVPVLSELPTNGHAPPEGKSYGVPASRLDRSVMAFGKRLEAQERLFLNLQKAIFNAQRRSVLAKLRSRKAITKQAEDVFDLQEWTVKVRQRGEAVIRVVFVAAAVDHGTDFQLGPFNSELLAVREWVRQRTEFWADRVNQETAKLLLTELQEGAQMGEGIPQLSQRVEKVFNFNDAVRAERIARTETLAASNAGHLEIYRQSGVVDSVMWVAAMDERTRPAHAAAHGQVVPMGLPFQVGGESLEAPGIGGSPGNSINCRCETVPVLNRRSLAATVPLAIPHKKKVRTLVRDGDGSISGVIEEELDA